MADYETSKGNTWRFMPGRELTGGDNRILFNSLRYSRKALPVLEGGVKAFKAGIGVGPGQHMPKESAGPGFLLSPGAEIVEARPNEKREPVPVRDFKFKDDDGKMQHRQFIDWATFQQIGDKLFAVPFSEDMVGYVEVWTGDFARKTGEGTFQLIQSGMFDHGSVGYSGGTVLVNAGHKKAKASPEVDGNMDGVRNIGAELVSERSGDVVGGVPLWVARLWRIRYSATDSESVLVRQLGKFYLVLIEKGVMVYREMPAAKFERQFQNLTVEQKLVPIPGAEAESAAA